jgi:hypothetical protein
MYSSPDPPPAPDYVGAAERQGEEGAAAARPAHADAGDRTL